MLWDAGAGDEVRRLRTRVTEPAYLDVGLQAGKYSYWVTALGPGGESEPASVGVTVP